MNQLWCALIVEELRRNGVDYFCIAPGSRSGPLAISVSENKKARSLVHFDERGLAFHALGYARATGRAAVIITTSGTAVANLYPAVVEASQDRIPMIILTADRPFELRDTGANQTIDQPKFFSSYVRWHADIPAPSADMPAESLLTTIDQACYKAVSAAPGPVHINIAFREPLAYAPTQPRLESLLRPDDKPYTIYKSFNKTLSETEARAVAAILSDCDKGLIVLGRVAPLSQKAVADLAAALAEKLKFPLLADITSGGSVLDAPTLIPHYDLVLRDEFTSSHGPRVVLHLGGLPTSRGLSEFLARSKPQHYIVVADHGGRQDPYHAVTLRIEGDHADFLRQCLELVADAKPQADPAWLSSWKKASLKFESRLESAKDNAVSEPAVASHVSKNLPKDHGLFLASSMPIRYMDAFGATHLPVAANRGASGIDGTIGSASGFATGLGKPVTLLIGDMAFLHDLNSLALLRRASSPLTVVLMNNDGGGIFSHLPIAKHKEVCERYFTAPHGLSMESAARLFGIAYSSCDTLDAFMGAYAEAIAKANNNQSAIVEVKIKRGHINEYRLDNGK